MAQTPAGSGTTMAFQGNLTGPPTTVNLQQMSDLVQAVTNSVRALATIAQTLGNSYIALAGNNTFTGTQTFSKPPQLPVSTVAALPAIALSNVGSLAFASNGRNTGEGAGSGTGCTVQVQSKAGTATWCAIWSGVAVTS